VKPVTFCGTTRDVSVFICRSWAKKPKETAMRGILLWLLGIPIPIIILLYLFNVL
jgi:hypothetical protein